MNLKKTVILLCMFVAAFLTPALAQINWNSQSPAGITDDIWCATYANGTFAAVTSQGKVLTSSDGLTWSSQTIASGTWLVSIAYGNGTWVAVGASGTILVSSNLTTWVSARAVTQNKLNGVLYNGAVWLAVGDSATIITSPDALNWTVQTVPANTGVTGFLHGITWNSVNSFFSISGAVAGNGTGSIDSGAVLEMSGTPISGTQTYSVFLSGSGSNLLVSRSGTVGNLEAILGGTGLPTVAVGWLGTVLSSQALSIGNGSAQLTPSVVPTVVYRGLAYGNGYWVAAGEQGTILTSTDGANWTQRFSGSSPSTLSTATLLGATYASSLQRFVVVGTGGTILVSNSIPTVFANVSTRGLVSSTQNLIGGFVVEGTAPRTILIRADGPILGTVGVSNPLPDPVLTVYNVNDAVVATNTGWATNTNSATITTAALEVGAFPVPNPSPDSALLLTLQPGAYTVVITSAKGNTGTALFEAYTD
jgi:hypothetical protein